MAKDDNDLDDLDFDDFDLGFDDDGMDPFADDEGDRNPIATSVKSFGRSVGESLVSKQALLSTSKDILPDSYGKAVGLIEEAGDGLRDIYDSSKEELVKSAGAFRSIAKSVDNKFGGRLPSIISDKLKAFVDSGDESSSYQWGSKNTAETITEELTSVFGEQMAQQAISDEVNREEQRLSTAVNVKQSRSLNAHMGVVADGINRLVSYQDTVTNRYQRKSLELQYKQFFLQKELVERSAEYFGKQLAFSKGIERNSGLPDAQKIQKSELMAHTIKERMVGASLNKMSEFANKFTKDLGRNIGGWAQGAVGGLTQGAEFYQMTEEIMASLPESERRKFLAQQAGGLVGERLRSNLAERARPLYDKFAPDSVRRGVYNLGRFVNDPFAKASEYARSETNRGGLLGRGEDFLKSMLPVFSRDSVVDTVDQFTDADEVAYFDSLSRRSITEIIPEYLSQIARWTKATFTGTDDGEMGRLVYDHISGEFTSKSTSVGNIRNRLFSSDVTRYDRDDLNRLVKQMIGDEIISPDAMSLLRRQLLESASNNATFDPVKWGQYENYTVSGTPDAVDELVGFFRGRYNISPDGELGHLNKDTLVELDDLGNALQSFKSKVSIPTSSIQAIAHTYGKDALSKLGLMDRDSRGRSNINYDALWDNILGENINPLTNEVVAGREYGPQNINVDVQRDDVADRRRAEYEYEMAFFAQEQAVLQERLLEQSKLRKSDGDLSIADSLDLYLGESSPVLQAIERINLAKLEAHNEAQEQYLHGIFTTMAIGNLNMSGPGAVPRGSVFGWLRNKGGQATKMTGDYFRFWGRQYRRVLSGAGGTIGNVASSVRDTAMSTGRRLLGLHVDGVRDIYVKGRLKPTLLGRDIRDGLYKDSKTDKVIRSLDDITGEVVDLEGNIVLSNDDYELGLLDNRGKAVVFKGWDMLSGYYGAAFGLYGKAFSFAGRKLSQGMDWLRARKIEVDLYVKDKMDSPVLSIYKLRAGEYFGEDGKVLRKWSDIKDKVYDIQGNLVISMEDIKSRGGFVNVSGETIRDLGGRIGSGLRGAASRLIGGYGDFLGGIGRGIGNIGAGIGRRIGGIFGRGGGKGYDSEFEYEMTFFAQEQTVLQERILEVLQDMQNPERNKFDRSGDGLRDGSAEAIRAKRAERKAAKEAAKEEGGGRKRGVVGRVTGAIGDKIKEGASTLGGWATAGAGAAGAALWGGVTATASAIGTGAVAAGGMLWSGVAGAATLIGGTVSLPALAIGAAVVGTGYVGWKLWKRFTREDAKILELRMAQYGVHFSDRKEVETLLNVETLLEPYASINIADNTGTINTPGEVPKEFLELFGVDTSPGDNPKRDEQVQRIAHWFKTRFQPVFIAHLSAKEQYANDIPLHELDSKIDPNKALEYLEIARCDDVATTGAWEDTTSPFKHGWVFDAKLSETSGDVDKFYISAFKFFSKRATNEGDDEYEEPAFKDKAGFEDPDKAESRLMKAASSLAMVTPMGQSAKIGKALFDKITDSKAFGMVAAGVSTAVGLWNKGKEMVKDAVVDTFVPNFVRDGWNDFWEDDPGHVELIRFMTYGLVDVEGSKIQLLRRLESAVMADIDESGNWSGDPSKIYAKFTGRFKIRGKSDGPAAVAWKSWFMNRFLPTLIMTLKSLKSLGNVKLSDVDKGLSPAQRLELAIAITESTYTLKGGVSEPTSVWTLDMSPWPGYIMNTVETTTGPIIAKLQDEVDGKSSGIFSTVSSWLGGVKDFVTGKSTHRSDLNRDVNPQDLNIPNAAQKLGSSYSGMGAHGGSAGSYMGGSTAVNVTAGTGGDIDKVPMPTGDGWEHSKDTIIEAAKIVGIDPALAASIAGQESSWRPGARPWSKKQQRYLSSAKGYYQFIDSTWKQMMDKHADKYGIPKGTTALDPRANALLGSEYIKEGYEKVKKNLKGNREPTDVDVYLHHFLGPGGVAKFLATDPNAPSSKAVSPASFKSNPAIFNPGGKERTVAQVYQYMDSVLSRHRSVHGLSPSTDIARPTESTGEGTVVSGVGDDYQHPDWVMDGLSGGGSYEVTTTGPDGKSATSSSSWTTGKGGGVTGAAQVPTGRSGMYATSPTRGSGGGSTTLSTGPVGNMDDALSAVGGEAIKLILQREPSTDSGTYGKLTLPDGASYVTLELGWRNNKPRSSCIPAGTYAVKIKNSPKFGTVYRLEGVPGRSEILIHAGNVAGNAERGEKTDVLGCILLGTSKDTNSSQPRILGSRDAMSAFMLKMGNRPFVLTILDGGVTQATLDKELPIARDETSVTRSAMATSTAAPPPVHYSDPQSSTDDLVVIEEYTPTSPYDRQEMDTRSAIVADTQSRSRDVSLASAMESTEGLLVESNKIASAQLEVLSDIRGMVRELSGKEVTKGDKPKRKEDRSRDTSRSRESPVMSGIAFARKRDWI